jgi:carboxyl-terminal processing protease
MNSKSSLLLLFLVITLSIENPANAQDAKCTDAPLIVDKIFQVHVSPPDIYSLQFKSRVLENFVREMDPQALYFSEVEAKKIKSFPLNLTKENSNVCDLIALSEKIFRGQLTEYKKFVTITTSQPIDFSVVDYFAFELNPEQQVIESDNATLKNKWKRWLKLKILMRMHRMSSQQKSESLQKFEKEARSREATRQIQVADRLADPSKMSSHLTKLFCKALANSFDPHTDYFTKEEMKDFDMELSKKKFSWGFGIGQDKFGQAVVQSIVPGGPAWKSNAIHKDYQVIAIQFDDGFKAEAIDYEVHELAKILEDPTKIKMTITLQRLDGELTNVSLEKSEIESDENFVQGYVLKSQRKFGYISLPAFYTDWSDPYSKGCANDVAKEIVKLKKENIEGLILDLRFNGGGLVSEAVDLSGIFIDFGPLMIFKSKDKPPLVLKDINRGIAYDGPLLILINGFSASASELMAGVLQDYHRAIIVGSTSFGKATGQSVMPLVNKDSIGFVKVTEEKIYKINGKTHQKTGIKPDIPLPDLTSLFKLSEQNYSAALSSDSISKKLPIASLPPIPVSELRSRSEKRVANSEVFKSIIDIQKSFELKVPLQLDAFSGYMKKENLNERDSIHSTFQVLSTNFDDRVLKVDSYANELKEKMMEELKNSPYLEEAIHILEDYKSIQKQK